MMMGKKKVGIISCLTQLRFHVAGIRFARDRARDGMRM